MRLQTLHQPCSDACTAQHMQSSSIQAKLAVHALQNSGDHVIMYRTMLLRTNVNGSLMFSFLQHMSMSQAEVESLEMDGTAYQFGLLKFVMFFSAAETVTAILGSVIDCHFVCFCCQNCCCKFDVTSTEKVFDFQMTNCFGNVMFNGNKWNNTY